jgi:heme exporter protein A
MLTAQSLSCRRSGRTIFRDIGFKVEAGGFLLIKGPNGSGKSSLLRLLAGLLKPDHGVVLWRNAPLHADPAAFLARTHYIGHLDALKPALTALEMMYFWCALRNAPSEQAASSLHHLGLGASADRPVKALSAGQKRRLSLCRLLIGETFLWILDEPTTALDAASQKLFWHHIAWHRAKGGMVIAALHEDVDVNDLQTLELGGAPS